MLTVLAGTAIFAHGSIPNAHQVTSRAGTPAELWVETTFGLVVSRDEGTTWDWICEEAVGYAVHAGIHVAPSGRVFAATFDGLFVSDDGGCTWSKSPLFANLSPTDVHALPSDPARMFITTSRYMSTNGLFRSDDSGSTWTLSMLKSDTLFFSAARAAPSLPGRIYVSAWWAATAATMKLFRSDDGGDTFTDIDLSAAVPKGAFTVWAVHPSNPDVLLASVAQTAAPGTTILLRSDDAGATFAQVLTSDAELNGVSFSMDGSRVFVGSDSGFFRSADGGKMFEKLAAPTTRASPFVSAADVLYATGSQLKDGFALARSSNSGATFTPVLQLSAIRGPLECPAGSTAQLECPKYWPVVKAALGATEAMDAGTSGAVDAGPEPDPSPPPGCGCGAAAAGMSLWMLVTVLLAAAARLGWRRIG